MWLSADPAIGEYIPQAPINDEAKKHNENLPGMGGVFNYVNLHVYHYAGNNPVKYTDPDGRSPIYDIEGNLLGTDDNGLQGDVIIIHSRNFIQGMSHEDAMSYNLGVGGLNGPEAFDRFTFNFNGLVDRPDYDGYLTLKEANEWYRNGNGQPLFVSLDKLNLDGVISLGEKYVGQVKSINLLFGSSILDDALVYGNITLKRYPNHQVRAYADTYDFDIKPWYPSNWIRNIETLIGSSVAGKGQGYSINFYGSKTLVPLFSWIK
jgi:hypothetical protein